MVEPILSDVDFTGANPVILFVNSMGATPLIELYVMYAEVAAILEKAGADRAVTGRAVHHEPGHGGLLGDPAARRRRVAAAVGPSGRHTRIAERMLTWTWID